MGLLRHQRLIVGYDLGESFSQISYSIAPDETETLSCVAGEEQYNIPTVLCKRYGTNQWLYGKEALRCAQQDQGILVENIVQLARNGEPVQIDETTFEPVSLLALFMKRSLGMLSQISSPDKLYALMITCGKLDQRMVEVLNEAVAGMHLKTDKVFLQNHKESFYHYVVRQPEELWRYQTLLLEYREEKVSAYRMSCNRRTTPVVAFVEDEEYPMPSYEPLPEGETLRQDKMRRLDAAFLKVAEQACGKDAVSCVYLIGEHYSEEWMKESLRFLCMGRRVFQGNNLYSKGACFAMAERTEPTKTSQEYVFLGSDKLKDNIGMKILNRGEESYYAILDAGVNWYEADHKFEFYIQDGNCLEVQITPLAGSGVRAARITLDGMPQGISRMCAHFFLTGEKELVVEIEDLGFGSFRPAAGHIWREEIAL